MRIWIAALAAAVVPPLLYAGLHFTDLLLLSTQQPSAVCVILLMDFFTACGSVFVLGIPVFFLLLRLRRASWTTISIAGVAIGALPTTAFYWPSRDDVGNLHAGRGWHGHYVETYNGGVPTTHAWLIYGEGVVYSGVNGLICALVFYGLLRKLEDCR